MEIILVNISSKKKATELKSLLSSLNYVSGVKTVSKKKQLIDALKEHDAMKKSIVKKKNSAIAKYL
jgi:sorbitol-specific phosphotransferase system component IIBC